METSVSPTTSNGVTATSTIRWIRMTRTAVASVTETGKNSADRLAGEEALQEPHGIRHQLVIGDGNAEEEVDLGALPQHPERREGPEPDLVRPVPGQRDDRGAARQQRELVIEDGLQGVAQALPAGHASRTRPRSRSGQPACEKGDLLRAPEQDGAGEGDVGAADAGIAGRKRQAAKRSGEQHACQQRPQPLQSVRERPTSKSTAPVLNHQTNTA